MTRAWRWASTVPLAVTLLGGCGGAQRGGFQMPPVPVEVAEARRDVVRDRFHAVGTIEAAEIVKVVNEVNAVVREMPFTEGQSVDKGDLLAQLDDREIGAEAQRAEALRDQARINHARVQQLFEQQAASPQELDDASAALKVADANSQLAKARFEKTRIRSPLSGVVGRRLVSPGAYLGIGDQITEVVAVDEVKVVFAAPERYLGHLHRNARVEVSTTAYPGQSFQGRMSVVDPVLDPQTRTVRLTALVANPGRRLRPGMSADVAATLSERADALTVPDEAVFAQGDQNFVFVVKPDSTVTRQAIVVGSRDSARVEVTTGLVAGDRVVRAGYQKLFEGARVMPVPAGGAMGGPGGGMGSPGGAAGAAPGGASPGSDPKGGAGVGGKARASGKAQPSGKAPASGRGGRR
jgi:membrane fusion protein (multidrug efflux system)